MRRLLPALLAALAAPAPAMAQESGTTVTLTVGPSFVNFADFGGSFGAAVAQLIVSRSFTRATGGEISAFAVIPAGGATATPGCVPGGACQTRSTPNFLSGVLTSVFAEAGETGLRASIGAGVATAAGGEGLENRSSLAGVVGLDWLPRTTNRFVPTLALRLVQLSQPIAGARQLLLPGLGLRF